MKKNLTFIVAASLISLCSMGQRKSIETYFQMQPRSIQEQDTGPQQYNVILKWQNLDAISGQIYNCNAVTGTYTTGFQENMVRWENVHLAQIEDFSQVSLPGRKIEALDKFTYKAMDTSFLSEKFYEKIPAAHRDLTKWLVSDAIQMHGLAWYVFDSLEYKKEFTPQLLKKHDIQFENWVTFSSRYQKLVWNGIGLQNNEVCAIVKFESLNNSLKIDNEQMKVKGRSLYYGEMWISLSDKQVEYSVMVEDVVMRLTSSVFPDGKLLNLQREVTFKKQK